MAELLPHAAYAAAWISFGFGHSLLAGTTSKRFLTPLFGPAYRLAFNLFALLHLAGVFAVGAWAYGGVTPWPALEDFRGAFFIASLVGWVGLFLAARDYDMGRFSGLAQVAAARRGEAVDDEEALNLDGLHRYVRHPLYTFAFIILWAGAWTPLGLATAIWGSLYLLVGTWSEERRLVARFGGDYADYQRRVPAFVPWRGKAR